MIPRIALVLLVSSTLAACPETPGELRPLLVELFLPASLSRCNPDSAQAVEAVCGAPDECTRFNQVFLCQQPSPQEVQSFSVRNISQAKVTLIGASFEASDAGGGVENFTESAFDRTELFGDDVASLRFTYITPDPEAQVFATLVITSDATVNPRLEVPVTTFPFVEAGGESEGEGEGEGEGE